MKTDLAKITFLSILFFVLGVGVASFLFIPFFIYISVFLLILIYCILYKVKKLLLVFFILLFFSAGIIRYDLSVDNIDENHIGFYNNSEVVFQGEIIRQVDQRINKNKLTIGNINMYTHDIKGRVLVNTSLYTDYKYGDVLKIKCNLNQPGVFNKFDYHEYLARFDVYSVCYFPQIKIIQTNQGSKIYSSILLFKNKAKYLIDSNFNEPQASFVSALILGLKRQVPEQIRNWFSMSGTAHILAISGLHISILTKLIMIVFITVFTIPRNKAFYPVAIIIGIFIILAGAPASAIRAGIMGLVLIYSEKISRPQSSTRLILLACALMLFVNPKLLKSDIGFQLSFAAVLGLNYFTNYFNYLFHKLPNFRFFPIREYLSATLSAQIFVLPLILYYFGNLSLIAPLANILVLIVMPIIMIFAFLFIILGSISLVLSKIIFWPLWILLTYIILIAKIGSSIPYMSFIFSNFSFIFVIILYILIFIWLNFIKHYEQKPN